jgi:serine/threonine protein kinase
MDVIPTDLALSIQKAGWTPGKRINEGGGGTVFACFPKAYVDLFDILMNQARTQVNGWSGSQMAVEMGNRLISDNLTLPSVAAVKIPHALLSHASDQRLSEEIRAMASFSHPNLIRLLTADPGTPPRWFIMEYYSKGTLEENCREFLGKPLRALEALRPIVEGVSLLHRHETIHIHRDIKPKNVFVSKQGQLVLGDFGIVFTKPDDRTRLTKPGEAPYSRDWIPEWVRHRSLEEFSPKVDVYMLAKVLYYMLANRNVLPSQLDDKDFDLREMFPDAKGIGEVYDLLTTCIVSKEASCQPNDAGELLGKLNEVIARIHGKSSCLLFNFFSVGSNTGLTLPKHYGPGIKSLTDIQVYLPVPGREFVAKARVWGGDGSSADLGFSLGPEESNRVIVNPSNFAEPGLWSKEILLTSTKPLDRGWHTLSVKGSIVKHQTVLTGFMLYAI